MSDDPLATKVDHLLIRRPMLPIEQLVVAAYDRVRTVTEIRVRWLPQVSESGNMFGRFLVVVSVLGHNEELQSIQREMNARIGPMPYDIVIDYISAVEAISYPDYPVILRRSWEWYYETGNKLPKREDGQ